MSLTPATAVPGLGVVLYVRSERITGGHLAELADRVPNVIGLKYGVRDAAAVASPLPADIKREIPGILASWGLL